jgi:hypothetical protein
VDVPRIYSYLIDQDTTMSPQLNLYNEGLDSSVGVATGSGLGKTCLSSPELRYSHLVSSSLIYNGDRGFSLPGGGGGWTRRQADHTPPTVAAVNNTGAI